MSPQCQAMVRHLNVENEVNNQTFSNKPASQREENCNFKNVLNTLNLKRTHI
jgi:hypothetical protein